jgi:hypothetical protein
MTARRIGALCWAACVAATLGTLVLLVLHLGVSSRAGGQDIGGYAGLALAVAGLSFATVGAAVTSRVSRNPIGPIFCVTGANLGVGVLAYQWADRAVFVAPGSLPGGATAAWIENLCLPQSFGLLALALLLFPDGRLPSRRWRAGLWLAIVGIGCSVIGYALRPGPLDRPFDTVTNPVGLTTGGAAMEPLSGFGWLFMTAAVALGALAIVGRMRRSHGIEREQLKWIGLGGALAGAIVVADAASFFVGLENTDQARNAALGLAFTVFPLAAGAAILRYRLYDIDVVINRTLVYAALTATLAGAYLATVLVLQLGLNGITGDSGLAVAGSTLAVAALFRPARGRIQAGVDRRFYRSRYDAQQTVQAFSGRLRDEVDLDRLDQELGAVVRDTLQPTHVSLWLRRPRTPR